MNLFKRFTAEGKQDAVSPTYCAAKWFEGTIWLDKGVTASCHHTPLDPIKLLPGKPDSLFNSPNKMLDRVDMMMGKRPPGCSYCWDIEDAGGVSDRRIKSKSLLTKVKWYKKTELSSTPVMLEIAFDRTCNLACAYCGPTFSSKWANDIKQNGPYTNLITDSRYNTPGESIDSEDNPYVDAFFAWWPELEKTLKVLRITGGEPLMSGYTWKLIEWFKANQGKSSTKLAINSNLGFDSNRLSEFIESIRPLPHVELYTSMEATALQAEYIRDGLDYQQWLQNVHTLLKSNTVKAVHVMCTINALCLDSLPKLLTLLIDLKQRYGRDRVNFTLNILRFPSFQSALVLPPEICTRYKNALAEWMYRNRANPWLHEHEVNQTQRLIDYLDVVKTPHSDAFDMPRLLNDFAKFYQQYDQRRGKDFATAFPELKEWYNEL